MWTGIKYEKRHGMYNAAGYTAALRKGVEK